MSDFTVISDDKPATTAAPRRADYLTISRPMLERVLLQWEEAARAGYMLSRAEVEAQPAAQAARDGCDHLWYLLAPGVPAKMALEVARLAAAQEKLACRCAAPGGGDPNPPRIGEQWWGQGGIYAGVVRGADGDYHLILAQEQPATHMDWPTAKAWAERVTLDHHRDFRLPDRRESALLFANLQPQFEAAWYWTGEQDSAGDAWLQYFASGGQGADGKGYKGRARAVRRFLVA